MGQRIFGIDPGTLQFGYGLLEAEHGDATYVTAGVIKAPRSLEIGVRLYRIHNGASVPAQNVEPRHHRSRGALRAAGGQQPRRPPYQHPLRNGRWAGASGGALMAAAHYRPAGLSLRAHAGKEHGVRLRPGQQAAGGRHGGALAQSAQAARARGRRRCPCCGPLLPAAGAAQLHGVDKRRPQSKWTTGRQRRERTARR